MWVDSVCIRVERGMKRVRFWFCFEDEFIGFVEGLYVACVSKKLMMILRCLVLEIEKIGLL